MPTDADQYAGIARSLEIYDRAPTVAKGLFNGTSGADALHEIFTRAQRETKDPLAQQLINSAFNYAKVNDLYRRNQDHESRQMLGFLVDNDTTISVLDQLLRSFGSSYADECARRREFLIPKALDRAIFERYAPQAATRYEEYASKQGLGVSVPISESPQNDKYVVCLLWSAHPDSTDMGTLVGRTEDLQVRSAPVPLSGSQESIERSLKRKFKRVGVDDYLAFIASHAEMPQYLANRFFYKKIAQQTVRLLEPSTST